MTAGCAGHQYRERLQPAGKCAGQQVLNVLHMGVGQLSTLRAACVFGSQSWQVRLVRAVRHSGIVLCMASACSWGHCCSTWDMSGAPGMSLAGFNCSVVSRGQLQGTELPATSP